MNRKAGPLPAWAPGIALAAALAGSAFLLHRLPALAGISPLLLAILLGMLVSNTVGTPCWAHAGLAFSLRAPLRAGIVLLGLQLTFAQVAGVGLRGLAVLVAVVAATYLFTVAAGRMLGIDTKLARLIAVGTAICGASAIVAANAVIRDREGGVPYALGVITLYGTITMLLLPLLPALPGLGPLDYGLWVGASVHELAQVVAAGFAQGVEAGQFATVSKLSRVLLLVPMVMLLAWGLRRPGEETPAARPPLPWFVLGFLLMVGLSSTGWLPEVLRADLKLLTQALLALALAAVGLETAIGAMLLRGWRALLLGGLATVFIVALSLALILAWPGAPA